MIFVYAAPLVLIVVTAVLSVRLNRRVPWPVTFMSGVFIALVLTVVLALVTS